MKKILSSVMVLVCVFTASAQLFANGYKILGVKSAKATAMGEAFITQADDPSAIAFNPAGLAQLRGNQVNAHVTFCDGYTTRHSADGKSRNEDGWQAVPSVFYTSDLGRDDLAVGLGISFPNGLSSEWSKDSFARYVATFSDLIVGDISPSIGIKINDKLMLGAGISLYYSEAALERMVDSGALMGGAPNGVDLLSKLEGDGSAIGGNIGAIYNLTDKQAVAVTYRLPYSIDYDGKLHLGGVSSDIEAKIDFPAVLVLGYMFKPADNWTVEFNADWTHWNDVDDIELDVAGTPSAQVQDFENTIAYKLGAEYSLSETVDLRCGYIFNENATAEAAWRPSLPDTDIHFFTAGVGWNLERWTVDTALQLVYYETRTIDNNVDFNELVSMSSIDGTYRTWAPCVSIAVTYKY